MIPRLGDGDSSLGPGFSGKFLTRLENDSPSRGRKLIPYKFLIISPSPRLENDSPSRGRKLMMN